MKDKENELLCLLIEYGKAVAPCALSVGPVLLVPAPVSAIADSWSNDVLLPPTTGPGPSLGAGGHLVAGEEGGLCGLGPLARGPGE